jgi:hypothetical protein
MRFRFTNRDERSTCGAGGKHQQRRTVLWAATNPQSEPVGEAGLLNLYGKWCRLS